MFFERPPGLYLKFPDKPLKTHCQILYNNTLFSCYTRLRKLCIFNWWMFNCNNFGKKCFAQDINHGLSLRFSDVTFSKPPAASLESKIIECMDFSRSFRQKQQFLKRHAHNTNFHENPFKVNFPESFQTTLFSWQKQCLLNAWNCRPHQLKETKCTSEASWTHNVLKMLKCLKQNRF